MAAVAGEDRGAVPWDVAVVGCGPVGGVLATLLGRRGHRVLVVERHAAPYGLPRAVHFDHEVARILQACGLGEHLSEISEPGSDYEWRNATGQTLLRFGGRATGPSGWPDSNMFCQPVLEELIEGAAVGQPSVELRRGVRLAGLEDRPDGVALTLESGEGGSREPAGARYVVGCDGANSTVRDLIGSSSTDLGFFYDWLIVDVVLDTPRRFDPVNLQICDPVRPTTAVSGGPGRRRWEFMRLPGETVDELEDPATAWRLLEPWGITPGDATVERRAVYRFHARWADQWRKGNVLLAGDAAHQMPPFAGQGMCSGLRDAAALAWKLDLVLTGRAPDALLDTYQAEREENVRAVIDFSMSLGKVICVTDREEAAQRDALLSGSAAEAGAQIPPPLPGIATGIIEAGDPLAGTLFIQGRVSRDGGPVLLDDAAGPGWRLLTTDARLAAALPTETVAWFGDIGGAIVTVGDDDDVDGTYADWFAENGVTAVLQRPDFYIYGSAATPDGTGALLDALRGALRRPPAHLATTAPDGGIP